MLTSERTKYFIELYMAALRGYCNNEFLKSPKPGSLRYTQLDKAREIVDEINGEYSSYITVQFQAVRNLHIAPKPAHLISIGAVKRYLAYQARYNKYNKEDYCTNGDTLIVNKTRRSYPISQVILPISQDSMASRAYHISKMEIGKTVSKEERDNYLESLYYLVSKLKYKKTIIPESVVELIQRLENENPATF